MLLLLGMVYPGWIAVDGLVRTGTTEFRVPLSAPRMQIPVRVSATGRFSVALLADHTEQHSPKSCMLTLEEGAIPDPCVGIKERLRFHFRVQDAQGQVVRGNYGLPLEGDYPDQNRNTQPLFNQDATGDQFLILEPLPRGHYLVVLSAVRIPQALLSEHVRVRFGEEGDIYAGLKALPWLALSVLLALAGAVMLVVGALTCRNEAA